MKLMSLFLFCASICVSAEGTSQTITLSGKNLPLEKVFAVIKDQTGYVVFYNLETIATTRPVSVSVKQMPLPDFLELALKGQNLGARISGKTISLYEKKVPVTNALPPAQAEPPAPVAPPPVIVKGTILGHDGKPLQGASVTIKGTANGVSSDANGNYVINVPNNKSVLVFSYVGFASQERAVGDLTTLNITLMPEVSQMEDVVVVGYGTLTKSHMTGAVASVKSDRLVTRPVADIGQALSGQIAGLDVGAVTSPGETPAIVIRGYRSVNYNRGPLYVVDGIPRDNFSDIPVSDVQSIEVLKDAISTAIYGSRAANGVILITTKSGSKSGKQMEVGYNGYYGINSTILPELMDGDTYVQMRRDRARWKQYSWTGYTTGAPLTDAQVFTSQELPTVQSRNYVDWGSLLYNKTSTTQEHNVYIDNSTENTKTRFSAAYRKDDGYYPNNDFKRLSLGLKVDQNLTSFLKLNINLRYTNQVRNDVNPGSMEISSTQSQDIFRYINPLVRAYDDDGNLIEEVKTPYANPLLDVVNKITDRQTDNILFGVIDLKAKIFRGLTFTSTFGYDARFSGHDIFYPKNSAKRYLVRNSLGAYGYRQQGNRQGYTLDNYFNYKNTFGKHSIDATVVSSLQSTTQTYSSEEGNMLPDDVLGIWNMSRFLLNKEVGSSYSKTTTASFIGRFQYAYDNRYLAGFSVRRDGSSVLSEGHKWGTFPAASLGWIISNERFFKSSIVSNLKLRASYGSVGSATIDPYQSFGSIFAARTNFGSTLATGYTLADLSGTTRAITNKSLTWETSTTLNFGLDYALFGGRISGYAELYNTVTSNLIFKAALPPQTGFTQTLENVGSTMNKGIELSLSSVNINRKDFQWTTDLNFSTNKAYIKSLKNGVDQVANRLFIGQPWRTFYDNTLIGIWQVNDPDLANYVNGTGTNPGELKYKDISGPAGKPDGLINELDKRILGLKDPKWTMFLRNSFEYKNFSLGIGIIGKFGGLIQMSGRGWETTSYPLAINSDYWSPTNPTGKYNLVALLNDASVPSIATIRPGDYIRVQELTLNYHFKAFGIKDVRMGVITNNPFYLWRKAKDCIDPSAPNNSWQTSKSVVFKLDIKL